MPIYYLALNFLKTEAVSYLTGIPAVWAHAWHMVGTKSTIIDKQKEIHGRDKVVD